ncbi:MAG: ATPase component of uncharacterized ABC-type transporter [Bryobacterales bacterium]|nr:ATPase component of uncharacterized ABC-type transporter [Bryobacterales bacterium]
MRTASVEALRVTKRFGNFTAVDDVSLHWKAGSFHALLGENGAGKSTLVKCLMGFHQADAGEIRIAGEPVRITSPQEARGHGLGMVFQHFTLIPSMTVAENLVLARPGLPLIINWKSELARLTEFLRKAPFQVGLQDRVTNLSAGQKQKVEILKELYLETRLLILDEPTSVLTPAEADEVLGLLRGMVERDELSVLLITHKFREVMAFCDEVTVLRRGRLAGTGQTRDLTPSRLAEMMMGEARVERHVAKMEITRRRPLLKIHNLRAKGDNGLEAVRGLSLTVHDGEIVGIAGVSGNGQRELVEVIAGQRGATTGEITVDGAIHSPTREQLRAHRFFTLPEEPLRNASAPRMSVADNIALRVFDVPPFQRAGCLLDRQAIDKFSREVIERFDVRPPIPGRPIDQLSGGNVQRAILGRELSSGEVQVLVAANPCFGLDFKAVDFIHECLLQTRNRGAAILLISEDLDELLALADRIFVMSEGALVHETTPQSADLSLIGRQMAGHH